MLPVYLIYDQSKVCARQGVLQGLKDDVVQQVFLYEFCRAVLLAYGVPALVVFGHAPGLVYDKHTPWCQIKITLIKMIKKAYKN